MFPNIRAVIADAGHESCKLARQIMREDGWKLQIVKRRQRAFKIAGLTWIVNPHGPEAAADIFWNTAQRVYLPE